MSNLVMQLEICDGIIFNFYSGLHICDHQLQFGCAIAIIDCLRGVAITAEIPVATEFIDLQMGFQTLNMFSLLEQS